MSFSVEPPMRPGQGGYLRTFLLGGAITVSILTGAWMSMRSSKMREQAAGRNPHYEHVLISASERKNLQDLKPMTQKSQHGTHPPAVPKLDNHSPHMTIEQAKALGGDINEIRRMVPPPQRGRADDSGRAYPKSPDYADNYGKTVHARAKHQGGDAASTEQKTEGVKAW